MEPTNDLIKIYAECSNGYHKVDDFRAKLLGFLPLASGIGIFGGLYIESKLSESHMVIGIFGTLVTLGLLIYELKGITKCTQFIFLGKWIEGKMRGNSKEIKTEDKKELEDLYCGYFTELTQKSIGSSIVAEPVASAIIYSTVMAAWCYVIFVDCVPLNFYLPVIEFLLCFTLIYVYWQAVYKKCKYDLETLQKREAKCMDNKTSG